jgi:diguanylate cyclase (GGDEF)-like protein
VVFSTLAREMRRRTRAEREITERHAEQAMLLNLAELLQACRSLDESYDVILRLAPAIFSGQSGMLYLFRASRDALERHVVWGDPGRKGGEVFAADECWALRRGSAHDVGGDTASMYCKHMDLPHPAAALCLPMLGHGDVIGVLSLRSSSPISDEARRLAALATEQISMALANMQLRETLRNQSIRDPLTGLFNRRYAEETLPRELHRALREKTSVGVLMIDVDHFKRFNDTFGHEAGDYVLKELATCLSRHTRKGDVISRLGGEELLVLLPGSDMEHTLLKAEALRAAVAELELSHRGTPLGPITISIGVAISPKHGEAPDDVLRGADRALYRAKQSGRNRVLSAGSDA